MPDPIRVTRAVRRCGCRFTARLSYEDGQRVLAQGSGTCDCTDGWVDVPVDEQCDCFDGDIIVPGDTWSGHTTEPCPDCNGSGRRLHNWATGIENGDEFLITDLGRTAHVYPTSPGSPAYPCWMATGDGVARRLDPERDALVLSDPSHRPEPMRWKQ